MSYVSRIWYAATNATTVSQMSFWRALDPLPGPGVQVVVEGAEQADARQGCEGREGVRPRLAQEQEDPEDDEHDEQAAHRRRAFLDVVGLGALLADPLAEAERLEQPDVRAA